MVIELDGIDIDKCQLIGFWEEIQMEVRKVEDEEEFEDRLVGQ